MNGVAGIHPGRLPISLFDLPRTIPHSRRKDSMRRVKVQINPAPPSVSPAGVSPDGAGGPPGVPWASSRRRIPLQPSSVGCRC